MDFGNELASVIMPTSRPVDSVTDPFPAGLRVLVVDDDSTCLKILEKMLQKCSYQVTLCSRADSALQLLREDSNRFDIVLSDVHMPDMDGFKLLECIGLEMDLPVIMMSADDGKSVMLKGVIHGACDYLIKPVRIEALKNIWQHVVRKKKNNFMELENSGSLEIGEQNQRPSEDANYSSTCNEGNWRSSKRRKDEEDEVDDKDDTSTLKKPRVVWSVELHQQFVAAVHQLGIDKAVPKKILELMNVPGLTRENVASHLQKYRLYLRRLSGQPHHHTGLNSSFISSHEAVAFAGQMPADLQAFAGQLPGQSLASLQASGLSRPASKSGLPMSILDQRNLFSFESPRPRFDDQHKLGNVSKQMNLLHGIPTAMEPKQLASLHRPFGPHASQTGPLLVQMGQPPSILARNGRSMYSSVSQAPSMVDFPSTHGSDYQEIFFPSGKVKGMPAYDAYIDPHQHKSQNWEMQGLTFEAGSPVNLSSHGFSYAQTRGQNRNASGGIIRPIYMLGSHQIGNVNTQNSGHHLINSSLLADGPSRIKGENFGHQDDLLSALLKQQDGIGGIETDFEFDGFTMDNIPV